MDKLYSVVQNLFVLPAQLTPMPVAPTVNIKLSLLHPQEPERSEDPCGAEGSSQTVETRRHVRLSDLDPGASLNMLREYIRAVLYLRHNSSEYPLEVHMPALDSFTPAPISCLRALLFLGLVFLITCSAIQGQGPAPLSNDDIVKMVQLKFGDNVIVAKIKSSPCKFDTSVDALTKLKAAGVSDAVMQAMMEPGASASSTSSANPPGPPPDPNDPNAEHDPGIYYVRQNPGGRSMTQLEPTAYSGTKSGGMFKTAMTYGIAKANWKAVVRGAQSSIRTSESRPTFYFYFEQKKGTLSNSAAWMGWFGGLSSPNQFTLAQFQSKKNDRELVVGEFGAFGGSTGTRSKDVVDFDFEKIAPGIYKIVPHADMQPGEYCFFYTGQNNAMGMGGGNLFDFGINPAE
jgi:hypothetical protein